MSRFSLDSFKKEESARDVFRLPTGGRVRFFFLTFFMFSETDVFRPEDAGGGRRSVAAGRRFYFFVFAFLPASYLFLLFA